MASSNNIRHTHYVGILSRELEEQLVLMYQSAYCVKEYFDIYKSINNVNAITLYYSNSEVKHVIVFTCSGRVVTIMNELCQIEQEYIEYLAGFIFSNYANVTTINLNRMKNKVNDLCYPHRFVSELHDIVLQLPGTFEEYHAKLGKQTKKHIVYYINRLRREYSDFTFNIAVTQDIDSSVIGRIVAMNRLRMKSKKSMSGIDSKYQDNITKFSTAYGLVGTVTVNGQIVAGTICYEVGNHSYLHVISHDPEFNRFNVGQVCLYLTIKSLIERGRESFHMLWGESEYKYRFLGVKQELYALSLYRTRICKYLDWARHLPNETIEFLKNHVSRYRGKLSGHVS